MELMVNGNKDFTSANGVEYWDDFYLDYYQNLSSKELDEEFNRDIELLTRVLSKLPVSDRKAFAQLLSKFIEFYLENKVEKEIDSFLFKILKF